MGVSMQNRNRAWIVSRVALALVIVSLGCGTGERPAPAEEAIDANELAARAAAALEGRRTANDCRPWSWRLCRVYWTDSHGNKHCPQSTEVCRPEGHGWFPCGMYQLDEAGVPRYDDMEDTGPQPDAGTSDARIEPQSSDSPLDVRARP